MQRARTAPSTNRLEPLDAFLAANDGLLRLIDEQRRDAASRAAVTPMLIAIGLSLIFLAVGVLVMRRERRTRAHAADQEAEQREHEARYQIGQRQLSEALQVAENQAEAHDLVKHHLEEDDDVIGVHILNRNSSADRLEPLTPLPKDSPLAEPLIGSQPRSCIAVRLSREFARGSGVPELLECGICGRLPSQTLCRPLLVGGEVIGSVLVESQAPLPASELRRIEESVTAAAPVLANLRNLAVAETRAVTDALTGLPNRRSVDDRIKRMSRRRAERSRRWRSSSWTSTTSSRSTTLYGHERGDATLAAFGVLLQAQLRVSDFAGRSGGEEFIVLLPDTNRSGAFKLAEKLRMATASLQVEGVDRPVTASIGLSVYPDDATEERTLMRLADRALYAAKAGGRDRVESISSFEHPDLEDDALSVSSH